MVRCYDDLSHLLWGLEGLPLTVSSVQGAHPVLRYTEVRHKRTGTLSAGDPTSAPLTQYSPLQLLTLGTPSPNSNPRPVPQLFIFHRYSHQLRSGQPTLSMSTYESGPHYCPGLTSPAQPMWSP